MYFDENKLIVSVVKSENDKDNIKYTNYKIGNICYQLIEKNDRYYVKHDNNFKAKFETREAALEYILDIFIEK